MSIKQPFNTAFLKWDSNFASNRNAHIQRVQKYIDSECLRLCDPLTPRKSGELIRSGTRGTKIGSGELVYTAPYAKKQYYETAQTRSYDPNRGSRWFDRMKTAHKEEILAGAQKIE